MRNEKSWIELCDEKVEPAFEQRGLALLQTQK